MNRSQYNFNDKNIDHEVIKIIPWIRNQPMYHNILSISEINTFNHGLLYI